MRFCALVSPAILLAAAGAARAQCYGQQLIAGDPQVTAHNGVAAAMDGDYVLLGCPDKNTGAGLSAGEVYAYSTFGTQWGQVAHFFAPDPHANDDFGSSVAMGGQNQWAIVGAPGQSNHTGAAYIFRRDTATNLWNALPKLATGASTNDYLGASVGMNKAGTIAVVGVPYAAITDLFGTTDEAGQALVYVRNANNTWSYQATLHQGDASIRAVGDHFGTSVACDGSRVVTGVPEGDAGGLVNCGYISIWTPDINNYWTATGEIFSPKPGSGASFGREVAISGTTVVVGAPFDSEHGIFGLGAAYVYRLVNGAWVSDGTLLPADGTYNLQFGSSVSISGQRIVVGTMYGTPRTYLFKRTAAGQWVQEARYLAPSGINDGFGGAVAVDGARFVGGEWGYSTPNFSQAGCAWVFDMPTDGSDSCAGATPVSAGTYSGCTGNCTVDGFSTCGGTGVGPDIWFAYTAPATGPVTMDTLGSSFDTILSVHSGCPGDESNTIACNDDFAAPQRWSKATFSVTQGQTYRVRIAGYGNSSGAWTLNVGAVGACYANCDASTTAPVLNVQDFSCFLNKFAAGDAFANCDGSTTAPVLNVQDFSCFLNRFAAGCS